MSNADPITSLKAAAKVLQERLRCTTAAVTLRSGELQELIYDAEAREHRRAMRHLRDGRCYRLGSAFEPTEGLELDPVTLAGWLSLGEAGLLLLTRQMMVTPGQSITAALTQLFASDAGLFIRSWGVWVRWHWLRALYVAETDTFLASSAARRASWRKDVPTKRQTALVAAMAEYLQKEPQRFATRGDAFEWILANGAHPRFHVEPIKPDLLTVLEARS